MNKIKILALSDVRIHDWNQVVNYLKRNYENGNVIDLLLYGGDDVNKLLNLTIDDFRNLNYHYKIFQSKNFDLTYADLKDVIMSDLYLSKNIDKLGEIQNKKLTNRFIKKTSKKSRIHWKLKTHLKEDINELQENLNYPHLKYFREDKCLISIFPKKIIPIKIENSKDIYNHCQKEHKKSLKFLDNFISDLNQLRNANSIMLYKTYRRLLKATKNTKTYHNNKKKILSLLEKILEKFSLNIYDISQESIIFNNRKISIRLSSYLFFETEGLLRKEHCSIAFLYKTLNFFRKFCMIYEHLINQDSDLKEIFFEDPFYNWRVLILQIEQKSILKEIKKYIKYGVALVCGNDDFEDSIERIKFYDCFNLQEKPLFFRNLTIIGLEGSEDRELDKYSKNRELFREPRSNVEKIRVGIGPTIFPIREQEKKLHNHISLIEEKAPENKILIVSHSPPLGILDLAYRFGCNHIGSIVLREFIDKFRKKNCGIICGHVHSWGGNKSIYKGVPIYNISCHDMTSKGDYPPFNALFLEVDKNGDIIYEDIFNILIAEKEKYRNQPTSVLSNIGKKRQIMLEKIGINSIGEYAKIDYDELFLNLYNLYKEIGDKFYWGFYHKTYWGAKFLLKEIDKPKKLDTIEYERKNAIVLDLETELVQDRMAQDFSNTRIWMIGIYHVEKCKLKQFYLGNYDNIRDMLVDFLSWIFENEIETIFVYSSNKFDEKILNTNLERFVYKSGRGILPLEFSKWSINHLFVPKDFPSSPKYVNLFGEWIKKLCLPSYRLAEMSKLIFNKEDTITGFNCGQIGSHLIISRKEDYGILECKYCKDLVQKVKKKNEDDVVFTSKLLDYFEKLEVSSNEKKEIKKSVRKKSGDGFKCISYKNGMKNCYDNRKLNQKEYLCYKIVEKMLKFGESHRDESSSFQEEYQIQMKTTFSDISLKTCQITYFYNQGRVRIKRNIERHKHQRVGIDIIKLTKNQLLELEKLTDKI